MRFSQLFVEAISRISRVIVPTLPPTGDHQVDYRAQVTRGVLLIMFFSPLVGLFQSLSVGLVRAIVPVFFLFVFAIGRAMYLKGCAPRFSRTLLLIGISFATVAAFAYREQGLGPSYVFIMISIAFWISEGWKWGLWTSIYGVCVVGILAALNTMGIETGVYSSASAGVIFFRFLILFCTIIWLLRTWERNQLKLQERVDQQNHLLAERADHAERMTDCLSKLATDPIVIGPDLEAGLDRVQVIAAEFVDVDRASVWLIDEANGTLSTSGVFIKGTGEKGPPMSVPLTSCSKYIAELATSKIIVANDSLTSPSFVEFYNYFKEVGITALLDAPIWLGGKAVGVVCFEETGGTREWSDAEKLFASMIADQLSLVMLLAKQRKSEAEVRQINDELERRVAERTRELDIKNNDLEQFSYAISHDLRGPLRTIAGFSRILEQDYGDQLDLEGQSYLHRMKINAIRMSDMLDGILNYSRIGASESQESEISLKPFIEEIVESVKEHELIAAANIELDIDDVQVLIATDALRLCIRNLVSNALKFSSQEPLPRIRVVGKVDNGELLIQVEDNGIGFKMEYAASLFNMFQRLENGPQPGTGIGLALVAKAVERMGGTIEPESEPGGGATFTLRVPVTESSKIVA